MVAWNGIEHYLLNQFSDLSSDFFGRWDIVVNKKHKK